jgi:hypothetical protein
VGHLADPDLRPVLPGPHPRLGERADFISAIQPRGSLLESR